MSNPIISEKISQNDCENINGTSKYKKVYQKPIYYCNKRFCEFMCLTTISSCIQNDINTHFLDKTYNEKREFIL